MPAGSMRLPGEPPGPARAGQLPLVHGNRDTLKIERWTDQVLAMAAGGSSTHPTHETTAP